MSKFMMSFQIFFIFVFFIGVNAEANPIEACVADLGDFENQMGSLKELSSEEHLNEVCPSVTSFLECINNALKQETGFNLKQLAELLEGTDIGNVLALTVNLQDLVVDMCTEGTEFREEYKTQFECYDSLDKNIVEQCKEQADGVYEAFRSLSDGTRGSSPEIDEACITASYQLACYGAAIHETCGDEGFNFYKKVVRKLGLLKSGVCSSDLVRTIKTSLLERLDLSQSHKSLYRVVLDLKKRRK